MTWKVRAIAILQDRHLEHFLLLSQALLGLNLTGIGGLWSPRIELHFVDNLMVLIPNNLLNLTRRLLK
jgi:hypothetical protein